MQWYSHIRIAKCDLWWDDRQTDDAERAVNRVPYLKIQDKTYNTELEKLAELLKSQPEFKAE